MARTTNFFGDLTETIYDNFEKNAADVVNSIYNELITGTPRENDSGTPVATGTLKANWEVGIRPRSKAKYQRPSNNKQRVYPNPPLATAKTYNIHNRYYIWNNTPYLGLVNAGIGNNAINAGFIQKAIARGEARASGKI